MRYSLDIWSNIMIREKNWRIIFKWSEFGLNNIKTPGLCVSESDLTNRKLENYWFELMFGTVFISMQHFSFRGRSHIT